MNDVTDTQVPAQESDDDDDSANITDRTEIKLPVHMETCILTVQQCVKYSTTHAKQMGMYCSSTFSTGNKCCFGSEF